MERDMCEWLKNWKDETRRKPLIIRGARQVGKTWLVEDFGRREFKRFVGINFEFQPQMKSCFSTLDPFEIVQKIELNANVDVIPGETLLFLDEIQACPRAIAFLRYFHEELPDQHVIGAGSLLDFALREFSHSMPVGRIEFLHLHKPISRSRLIHQRQGLL